MTRKTKVRIVGDPDLAQKIADVIGAHFEVGRCQKFDTTPYRYAKSPGVSHYIDVKGEKEGQVQTVDVRPFIATLETLRDQGFIDAEPDTPELFIFYDWLVACGIATRAGGSKYWLKLQNTDACLDVLAAFSMLKLFRGAKGKAENK